METMEWVVLKDVCCEVCAVVGDGYIVGDGHVTCEHCRDYDEWADPDAEYEEWIASLDETTEIAESA